MQSFDVVVIGSGPGGYVAAIRAAQLGLKTACVEKDAKLGGTCLNVGCIPSKTLLHSSELFYELNHEFAEQGIEVSEAKINFSKMQEKKNSIVSQFNQGISGLFKKNKVQSLNGHAQFIDSHRLKVGEEEVEAKHFIIATGSVPVSLPFAQIDEEKIVSSTGALAFQEVPKKLVVIGAGIIGVELGSVYSRLGSEVHVLEFLDHICPSLDGSLSAELKKILEKQGIKFHLSTKVTKVNSSSSGALVETEGGEKFEADRVLVAVGRKPFTEGLNLEKAGITLDEKGRIPVNGSFQTTLPHILAIGDVIDGPMLAHKASEEGMAAAEIIAGEKPVLNYLTIASVVYTQPEVAGCGFTEEELKKRSIPYVKAQFPFKANSRAKCVNQEEGFVKMIACKTSGKVLGVHIIGSNAGELIAEASLALSLGATAHEIAESSHAHPTLSEAMKEAALGIAKKTVHI